MDDVTREIRQMLIGNLEIRGKYLAVSANKLKAIQYGMTDGADRIFLFGVMRHTRYYSTEGNVHKIKEAAHKALLDIGRKVYLESNPNAETVICRYMVSKPIVLLFEVDEIGIKVETYTARGIGGLISEAWVRAKFMRKMPDGLLRMSREAVIAKKKEADLKKAEEEKLIREERRAEREERKAEREERKAEREERKAEREEREKEEKKLKAAEKEREKALKKQNKHALKAGTAETEVYPNESVENSAETAYNENVFADDDAFLFDDEEVIASDDGED